MKPKKNISERSFEFTDQEFDPVTRSFSSTVNYLPDFQKAFSDLKTARDTLKSVAVSDETEGDARLDRIFDTLNRTFNELRTHMRKTYPEKYQKIKESKTLTENDVRLLVRKKLREISSTGGSASFSPGTGMGWATPYAFTGGTKPKRSNTNMYRKMGYKLVDKDKLAKKAKGIDVKKLW